MAIGNEDSSCACLSSVCPVFATAVSELTWLAYTRTEINVLAL